jgi:hypothetical protein
VTRAVTVELRSSRGRDVVDLDVSLLATDDAAVDMARQRAGISRAEFVTGEVIP